MCRSMAQPSSKASEQAVWTSPCWSLDVEAEDKHNHVMIWQSRASKAKGSNGKMFEN